jgi:hypothetical protein
VSNIAIKESVVFRLLGLLSLMSQCMRKAEHTIIAMVRFQKKKKIYIYIYY